jgi:aminoglycoside phosphotransferase (APT) family kinase protein
VLAQLHKLPSPPWLPPLDVLAVTRRRLLTLTNSPSVSAAELVLLRRHLEACQLVLDQGLQANGDAIVHGDITGNLLPTARGLVIIDFENTGVGDPAWDLARILHRYSRFATVSADKAALGRLLDTYTRAGGTVDRGRAQTLVGVVDLIGATWAVAGRERSAGMHRESLTRLAWLRGQTRTRWQPQ